MLYNKPSLTIAEQITKLKGRGLLFANESQATKTLANISYYRLRAYTYPFQNNDSNNQSFKQRISFEEIIQLYTFDRKLSVLIFECIEKIEISFRTQLIYNLSIKHGSHWHLKIELFRDFERFINHSSTLIKEVDRSNETFIEHYNTKYSKPSSPPCWMSLEVSSMGLLSKIFQNLKKTTEKKAITTHFGLSDVSLLENWMFCFCALRNILAHHGRIWNRRLPTIKLPERPTHLFLVNKNIHANKLYATLACIQYVLKTTNLEISFGSQLKQLMNTCPLAQSKEMGFPTEWEKEKLWI